MSRTQNNFEYKYRINMLVRYIRERNHTRTDKDPFPEIHEQNRYDGKQYESGLQLDSDARELGQFVQR